MSIDDDMLRELFQIQTTLQEKYGYKPEEMELEDKIEYIKWNSVALTSEQAEALQEIGWKPWASARFIDREPFVGELVDVLKFLLNQMLVVDVTPEELMQRFRGKTKVNEARIDNHYDGVSEKCPSCKRALDEPKPHKGMVA